jgi:uncharacterized protein (TIGR02757 family)
MALSFSALKTFLNEKAVQYNTPTFIESDPIQIPKRFSKKEDVEIAGFFAATIAWGNRASIIKSANRIMNLMDDAPHDFILNATPKDWEGVTPFAHRTFNTIDLQFFMRALQHIYLKHGGLHTLLSPTSKETHMDQAICRLRQVFFSIEHPQRTTKHLANPAKGSAAKRIHMFLRWMVRQDKNGVDFGIWDNISPSLLSCPLDVHSGNVARKLGLLSRKQNDQKALRELDNSLRSLDPKDPVKYDFALFGLGVFEKF